MNLLSPTPTWTPLALFGERFAANLRGLAKRRPALAELLRTLTPTQTYAILASQEAIQVGMQTAFGFQALAHPVTPAVARGIAQKLCPSGVYAAPVMVAGEDLGWLWNSLYALPTQNPAAPGHRSPLFLLIGNLERLWIMLHLQDWAALLADQRVRLFIGPDAFGQFRRSLTDEPTVPWPQSSVTLDPSLLPPGMTLESVLQDASITLNARLAGFGQQMSANVRGQELPVLAALFESHSGSAASTGPSLGFIESTEIPSASARPLNVLGITSKYTSFLQHSMRDWLAAFERLGHRTQLVIEQADHEVAGQVAIASAAATFKPDLVVCIDHYRKEMSVLPTHVPVAMWVQDAMPSLFSPAAGAAQGPLDYCLGFARLKLCREFGYPAERYMPAVVGLDEERFAPRKLSQSERERFGGEVAFVSHASMPAEQIIANEVHRTNSPEASRLLWNAFESIRAVYLAGGVVTEPVAIRSMLNESLETTKVAVNDETLRQLVDLFYLRVNNALFRHQSLLWLAESGVDLRLWGKGWEKHPTLARFAQGEASNSAQLPLIYQASKINLQVTPHGAVHQRLMEGLAAGGFFMIRQTPGDLMEREFRILSDWCSQNGVETDADFRRLATPEINARLATVGQMLQHDPFEGGEPFVRQLQASADDGYIRSAGAIWGADYDAVSYGSSAELLAKVQLFLGDEAGREHLAESMRQVVLDRFTYTATTRRLIQFIAKDLNKKSTVKTAA